MTRKQGIIAAIIIGLLALSVGVAWWVQSPSESDSVSTELEDAPPAPSLPQNGSGTAPGESVQELFPVYPHQQCPAGSIPRDQLPAHLQAFCIKKKVWIISRQMDIQPSYATGYFWCVSLAMRPGSAYTLGYNYYRAMSFCQNRGWYYVYWGNYSG